MNELENTKEFIINKEEELVETLEEITKQIKPVKKKFKFNKKLLIIILSFLFLCVVAIFLFIFLKKDKQNNEENNDVPENLSLKENYRYLDGTLIIYNDKEEEIATYECKNKDESLCFLPLEINDDAFDKPKKVLEDGTPIKNTSKIYFDRYCFIYDNKEASGGVIKFYDLEEQKEISTFLSVKSYEIENYVVLKNMDNKFALGNITNEKIELIKPFEFDYLGVLPDEQLIVSMANNKWSIDDFKKNNLVKNVSEPIKMANAKYISLQSDNQYKVINYKKEVLLEGFLYAELLDEFVISVSQDKTLRIVDYNGNKMNEEGIKLYNDNYTKTYIYDDSGLYKESISAFEWSLETDVLTVKTFNELSSSIYPINLLEGKFSSTLEYHNYLDGKLYFYKDYTKTELIGSYDCTYKNNVTSKSTQLDKCFIALDTNEDNNDASSFLAPGVTPIINNRYVFVRDALTLASDSLVKIYLVDLKEFKTIASYVSVNTYSFPNNHIPYHEENDSLKVIAKNKNAKYGLFMITKEEVVPKISFTYDSLEKLGDYYLAKKNNKWLLIDIEEKAISKEINYQIRNYYGEYLSVLNNKRYYVYNMLGEVIGNDNYKYVKLYENFYVGIDDINQLTIYNYEALPMINDNTIRLNEEKNFNIEVEGDVVILSFTTNTGEEQHKYLKETWDRID